METLEQQIAAAEASKKHYLLIAGDYDQKLSALLAQVAARDASPVGRCWRHNDGGGLLKVSNVNGNAFHGVSVRASSVMMDWAYRGNLEVGLTEIPAAEFDAAFRATVSKLAGEAGVELVDVEGLAKIVWNKFGVMGYGRNVMISELASVIRTALSDTK